MALDVQLFGLMCLFLGELGLLIFSGVQAVSLIIGYLSIVAREIQMVFLHVH